MAFDFFTNQVLAAELHSLLAGRKIVRAGFTQAFAWTDANSDRRPRDTPAPSHTSATGEPLTAALGFDVGSDVHVVFELGGNGFASVLPGSLPGYFGRGDGERYLIDSTIDRIWAEPHERLIRTRLIRENAQGENTYGQLLLELIHPRVQCLLLAERSGNVKAVWSAAGRVLSKSEHRELRTGEPYTPPSGPARIVPGRDSFAEYRAALTAVTQDGPGEGVMVGAALRRALAGADRPLVDELLHRAGLEPSSADTSTDLGEELLRCVWSTAVETYAAAPQLTGASLWSERGRRVFSALRPRRPVGPVREFATLLDAMCEWRASQHRISRRDRRCRAARQLLEREHKQLSRTREALERDLSEAAEAGAWERRGSILLSHLDSVRPGTERIQLPNTFSAECELVWIDLDRRISPAENAARFLKRARKLTKRLAVVPPRLEKVADEQRHTQQLLDALGGSQSGELPAELERWMAARLGDNTASNSKRAAPSGPHPRRYRTSSGWVVWVGRDQRENDELTHRMAAREDLWFHASGYPGSHVVLRREGRGEEPSSRTVAEAAAVAAYWSKGRPAKKVPVVYTLVKHVSKPKGGAPGLAVLRREKTIMVAPGLLPLADAEEP